MCQGEQAQPKWILKNYVDISKLTSKKIEASTNSFSEHLFHDAYLDVNMLAQMMDIEKLKLKTQRIRFQ